MRELATTISLTENPGDIKQKASESKSTSPKTFSEVAK